MQADGDQQESEVQSKLTAELKSKNIAPFEFMRVPKDYYNWTLQARQQCLGAASIEELCKSIVLENVLHEPAMHRADEACHSKHFLVLVQVCLNSS